MRPFKGTNLWGSFDMERERERTKLNHAILESRGFQPLFRGRQGSFEQQLSWFYLNVFDKHWCCRKYKNNKRENCYSNFFCSYSENAPWTSTRCQFHQHFMRAFFANILAPKITKQLEKAVPTLLYKNHDRKMLMKLTKGW